MSGAGRPGRLFRAVAGIAVVGGLALAHLEVLTRGPDYSGPLLVLDHLFDLGLAVVVMALSCAAGLAFLRRSDLAPEGAAERLLHRWPLPRSTAR